MTTTTDTDPRFSNALYLTAHPARVTPIRRGGHLITLALFPPERQPLGIFPTVLWEKGPLPPAIVGPKKGQKVYDCPPVAIWGRVRTVNYQASPAAEIRQALRRTRVKGEMARVIHDLLPDALRETRPAVRQDLMAVMLRGGALGSQAAPQYHNQVKLAGPVVKAALYRENYWALTLFIPNGDGRDFPVVRYLGPLPFDPESVSVGPFHTRPWVEVRGRAYTVNYEIPVAQRVQSILRRAGQLDQLDEVLNLLGPIAGRPAWLVRQEVRVDELKLLRPSLSPDEETPVMVEPAPVTADEAPIAEAAPAESDLAEDSTGAEDEVAQVELDVNKIAERAAEEIAAEDEIADSDGEEIAGLVEVAQVELGVEEIAERVVEEVADLDEVTQVELGAKEIAERADGEEIVNSDEVAQVELGAEEIAERATEEVADSDEVAQVELDVEEIAERAAEEIADSAGEEIAGSAEVAQVELGVEEIAERVVEEVADSDEVTQVELGAKEIAERATEEIADSDEVAGVGLDVEEIAERAAEEIADSDEVAQVKLGVEEIADSDGEEEA